MSAFDHHPYREAESVPLCRTCKAPALARCPCCGSPFCADHVAQTAACPSCELDLSRRADGVNVAVACYGAVMLAGLTAWLLLLGGRLAWLPGGAGFVGGLAVAWLGHWLNRRRASRGWALVDGAELRISADAGAPRERRLGWLMAGRGGDQYDQYGKAHEAGFNRVQGCG
jgi:hypothetical protein